MDRKLQYYKNVVKRDLARLKQNIMLSKNNAEKNYYVNRFDVQLEYFAKALNVREKDLREIISKI